MDSTITAKTASAGSVDFPSKPRVIVRSDVDRMRWNRFIETHPDGTLFHTTHWMEAVTHTFSHQPIYITVEHDNQLVAALPLIRVNSLFGGRLLVSLPYAVYGGVVGSDPAAIDLLRNEIPTLARSENATCVDLRSPRAAFDDLPIVDRYVSFRRPLPDKAEDCIKMLPRKARAAANAARKRHGLSVDFDDRHLPTVWRLYCNTMRRIGSLNYPYRFFEQLTPPDSEHHFVSLIRHRDRPIGGLVTFMYKGEAMPYFVGADARYHRTNVNNFLYLTAMEQSVRLGCHTFDFGRSRRDNQGNVDFKKHQGFTPQPLEYQRYTPPGRHSPDLTPSNPRFGLARRVWPALPGFLTRRLGAKLSAHIPG